MESEQEVQQPDPVAPLPQHLSASQQERLRALLDGKATSSKAHVRDTIADFANLRGSFAEVNKNLARATALVQQLRMEAASMRGAMDKCIRDVTRWEIDPQEATNPPPAPLPVGGNRKTKRRGKR